jgi:hypothetical protein
MKVRIANAHTDSPYPDIEEREREADVCRQLLFDKTLAGAGELSPSTLIVLSGDLNTVTTSELDYVISQGYCDTITSSDMAPAVESLRSATIGLTYALPEYAPRRSDFILYTGDNWDCTGHFHFGDTPIKDSSGAALPCARGVHGYLYPSDHLAVVAQFTRTSQANS